MKRDAFSNLTEKYEKTKNYPKINQKSRLPQLPTKLSQNTKQINKCTLLPPKNKNNLFLINVP